VESRPFCDHRINNKASVSSVLYIYSLSLYIGEVEKRFPPQEGLSFRRIRRRITIIHNNARDDDSDDDDAVYHRRREYVVVSKPDSEDYQRRD
jgi:hypothetical protein